MTTKEEFDYSEGQLERLYEWLMDENRKPAQTFFTAGWLRNVAREIESKLQAASRTSDAEEKEVDRYAHLKKRMREYFDNVTPEELVAKFEAMGYTFVELSKPNPVTGEADGLQLNCNKMHYNLNGIPCKKLLETGMINDYPAGSYTIYDNKFIYGKSISGDVVLEIQPTSDAVEVEKIICAAIWYNDGKHHNSQPKNIETGYVIGGRRHHNCIGANKSASGNNTSPEDVQGFLTNKDRFVDRYEALKLARAAGQILDENEVRGGQLYSEDLY